MTTWLVGNLAVPLLLLLATPAFGQTKEFFVYQGTPDQQLRLRAAVAKVKFPWDRLLPGMQANKYYLLVKVPEIDGVPGGDPVSNPLTQITLSYVNMAQLGVDPSTLSTTNPYGGQIGINEKYQGQVDTDFLVAYELGHVVDWFLLTNKMRAQLRDIMGGGNQWLGGPYADNNGEAWASGLGMAFADGYPMVADSSHHHPYPPAAVPQLYSIIGVQRTTSTPPKAPTNLIVTQ